MKQIGLNDIFITNFRCAIRWEKYRSLLWPSSETEKGIPILENDVLDMPYFVCIVERFPVVFILVVFAFNTKHFAIAIAFFNFLIPRAVFERTGKSFLPVFNLLLPKMHVTGIGPFSLETLANIVFIVLFSTLFQSWVASSCLKCKWNLLETV